MTIPDIALIVVAAVTVTAAILITCWHLHLQSYRRTLRRVRARRDAYRAEAAQLREERTETRWAQHVDAALTTAVDEPIDYTLPDLRWSGDNPAVAEYATLARAARTVRGVSY